MMEGQETIEQIEQGGVWRTRNRKTHKTLRWFQNSRSLSISFMVIIKNHLNEIL